ncbi:MAG TPA: hypothetical protein VGG72_10995 [Bryobacteraceae bacterium]|jgi:hypothetical protein
MSIFYQSGEQVRTGDKIVYGGSPGQVEYVVEVPTGDPAMDWHLTHSPNGGIMIKTIEMGRVFLESEDPDLDLVSRAPAKPAEP